MPEIVAASASMQRALAITAKAAAVRAPVVLVGPSGVGKECLARLLHEQGPRAQAPFVSVACAAVPEGLAESLFFGHARGAFSGAHVESVGHFVRADRGTLFLDDVATLSPALQAKLLRALDQGEVQPLGGVPQTVDVRLVAASQQPLEELAAAGTFREDLCYRLSALTVHLPPLVQRPEDVEALVAREVRQRGITLSNEARAALRAYRWPGNVRELLHVLEAASVLAGPDCRVELAHLPERLASAALAVPPHPAAGPGTPEDDLDVRRRTAALEKALMAEALRRTGGNRRAAARMCGLSPRAFLYKVREYGLE